VSPAPPARAKVLLPIAAALAVAGALAYSDAVTTNEFAWDDGYLVLDNPAIRDLRNVPDLFTGSWASGVGYALGDAQNRPYYRPLALASMAVDWAIAGPDPAVFHGTNLAIHVAAAFLLFLWLLRLLPAGSFAPAALAAAVFVLHPVHTEAVNVVSYRTTLLSGLFAFGSLAALTAPATRARVVAGVAAFALGLLSKETTLVVPGLLLVQDLWLRSLDRRRVLAVYLPLAAVAVAWLFVRAGLTTGAYYSYFDGLSAWQAALMVPRIFFLYVRLAVLPWPLCPFYDWSILGAPSSPFEPDVPAGAFLLASAVGGAVLFRRRAPLVSLGLAFFLVALLPAARTSCRSSTRRASASCTCRSPACSSPPPRPPPRCAPGPSPPVPPSSPSSSVPSRPHARPSGATARPSCARPPATSRGPCPRTSAWAGCCSRRDAPPRPCPSWPR